jgi:hypothetical protein
MYHMFWDFSGVQRKVGPNIIYDIMHDIILFNIIDDIMHDIMLDIMHDIINDIMTETHDIIYIYHDNVHIFTCTCIHSQVLCLIQDGWIRDCWIRHIAFTRRYFCQQISRMLMTKWTLGLLISTMTQILGIVATGSVSPLYPGA